MNKQKRRRIFPLVLILYAVIFLIGLYFGLRFFWDYIDAYERSRPHIAVDAYAQMLDADYVCSRDEQTPAATDGRLQTRQECLEAMNKAIGNELVLAKNTALCTQDKLVYAVLSGTQKLGSAEFTRTGDSSHGFTQWVFSGDEFDLSYLLTQGPAVTVPYGFQVVVNGQILTDAFITGEPIHYPIFEEYYASYPLPYRVRYETGLFVGETTLAVYDSAGNPVTQQQLEDPDPYISNCNAQQVAQIDGAVDSFIKAYVAFTTVAGNDTPGNYQRLLTELVPGGQLAKRMYAALDGLSWVSDRHAVIESVQVHHYIDLGDGRFLCDLTYSVTTSYYGVQSQSATHIEMIFLQTDGGLKAESMTNS